MSLAISDTGKIQVLFSQSIANFNITDNACM